MTRTLTFFLAIMGSIGGAYGQNTNLGSIINTDKVEYAPSISADGNTLIFQSNREGSYKLYISEKDKSGNWGVPKPIENVNKHAEDGSLIGGPSISYDGNFIFFFANFDGGLGVEDIYYTERKGNEWSDPVNVGAPINTRNYEGFPSISSDGKKLYFMRFAATQKYKVKFCYQLWVSERNIEGKWSRPYPLPAPVNQGCEKCPRIMSDNETLVFSAIRGASSNESNYDLYMSRLNGKSWSDPISLDFINTPDDEAFGSIPASGDIMYLNVSSNGNTDIVGAPLPVNLRPKMVITVKGNITNSVNNNPLSADIIIIRGEDTLNTGGLKSNAFDGNFTFVLTEGYNYKVVIGAQGFNSKTIDFDLNKLDEYKLYRRDVALDPYEGLLKILVLNSMNKDTLESSVVCNGNVLTGQKLLYESKIEFGKKYTLEINREGFEPAVEAFEVIDMIPKPVYEKIIELKPTSPKLLLTTSDKESGEKIKVYLQILDVKNKLVKYKGMMEAGEYEGNLDLGKKYIVRITRPSYFFYEEEIDLSQVFEGKNITRDVLMTPLKKGEKLSLNNITFELNSAQLTDDSKVVLENVFDLLKQNRTIILEIAAYTDDLGEAAYNLDLSRKRAQSVKDFLIAKGVPESMLQSKGYGESNPAVPNTSDENRALNRRVEFVVLETR